MTALLQVSRPGETGEDLFLSDELNLAHRNHLSQD